MSVDPTSWSPSLADIVKYVTRYPKDSVLQASAKFAVRAGGNREYFNQRLLGFLKHRLYHMIYVDFFG